MQIQDNHRIINNKKLYTRWIKPEGVAADAPVLVLLHEGLGCIEMWKRVPEMLAQATGMPVFLYERQGYGKSDPLELPRPKDYLEREAFDWLPQVLEAEGIQTPILFGHSDGGSIALLYAARYAVRAVIAESAHVCVEEVTLEGIRDAQQAFRESNIREKLQRYHDDKTDALFSAWSDTWLRDDFWTWNIEAYLPSISAPTLIVQGVQDEYATPAHVDRILRGLGSADKQGVLLPNCAHVPHLQNAEETLKTILEFIRRVVAS